MDSSLELKIRASQIRQGLKTEAPEQVVLKTANIKQPHPVIEDQPNGEQQAEQSK